MYADFSKQNRVKLYYIVVDYLSPLNEGRPVVAGLFYLDQYLCRCFGTLKLAPGDNPGSMIQNFILSATEEELLILIESVLGIYFNTKTAQGSLTSWARRDAEQATQEIANCLNGFLESIGSPARFMSDGAFSRDGFTVQGPEALLKLPNRDTLNSDIGSLLNEKFPISLIFVDLDNFKKLNDTKGHQTGDGCLEKVVALIASVLSKKGKLYRYGGDEFVALLPNFIGSEAAATAERIRVEIGRTDLTNAPETIKVTASIGVACCEYPELHSTESLINAVDSAMYCSKSAGRNCVTVWSPSSPPPAGGALYRS